MQAEHRLDLRVVERAVGEHPLGAAAAFRMAAFLRRLEQEHDRAGEPRLHGGQYFGGAHQHRDMIVVPARVHHADVLAVVPRAHGGLEGQVDHLRDGQRVHVGAQRDDAARTSAAQHADNAGSADALPHFQSERAQVLRHERGGAHFLPRQLGMLVDVTAPRHDLRVHCGGEPVELDVQRRCLRFKRVRCRGE